MSLDRYVKEKSASRETERLLIKQKRVKALDLGKTNFCMKGIDLWKFRTSIHSFNIF